MSHFSKTTVNPLTTTNFRVRSNYTTATDATSDKTNASRMRNGSLLNSYQRPDDEQNSKVQAPEFVPTTQLSRSKGLATDTVVKYDQSSHVCSHYSAACLFPLFSSMRCRASVINTNITNRREKNKKEV